MSHPTVNERLQAQIQFLQAQNVQFRLILGVLTKRLGGCAEVSQADFEQMKIENISFAMTPKPGAVDESGVRSPGVVVLETLTEDAVKARMDAAPRIEPAQPKLIVAP